MMLVCAALTTWLTPSAAGADPSDLGARWLRWRLALPALAAPDKDDAGHFCDVGQTPGTWFLAGALSFGSRPAPVRRFCTLPAGNRVFFPVLTAFRIVHDAITCDKAAAEVSAAVDAAKVPMANLDGSDLEAKTFVRWRSGQDCVDLNLPADGPSSRLQASVDGYWLTLGPFAPGRHTITFGGSLGDDERRDTRYELEVR